MHIVLQDSRQVLLSLSVNELTTLTRLVGAAQGDHLNSDPETIAILAALSAEPPVSRRHNELVQAWEDQGAVMVRVMHTFGDPVELGETEARLFSEQLSRAIAEAEGV